MMEDWIQPLSLVMWWAVGMSLRNAFSGRWRAALSCLGLALVVWGIGATPLSAELLARLERPYEGGGRQVPRADAVFVLGAQPTLSVRTPLPVGFGRGADGVMTGLELVRRGTAPHLVLGGGPYRWQGRLRPGSELYEVWLRGWRLPMGRLFPLGAASDVRDEVIQVGALARSNGWRRVVVVAPGHRLRRGEAALRKAGVPDVYAVGASFQGMESLDAGVTWEWTPRWERFGAFREWLHEELAWWYYYLKGWI